jgi:hypothetical protein
MMVKKPAYYFHAGGYIIATDAAPLLPDPVTGRTTVSHRQHIFVFDSAGWFAYFPGMIGQPAFMPTAFRVLNASAGRVSLAWDIQPVSGLSYQLQRADSSGAFTNIGAVLSTGMSTTADSSVVDGTSYSYRLLAQIAGGESGYTSVVSVVPGGITRTVTGLLFKDDFNRANEQLVGAGKSWTRIGSPSVDADWQIQSNQAKGLSVGAGATQTEVYPNAITAQTGDVVVQAWWSRANTNGRSGVTLVQPAQTGGIMVIRDPFHGWEVWNWGAGFYTHPADQAGFTRESGVLKLRRKVGRYQAWVDGVTLFDIASDARLDTVALYPALIQLQQPATWDSYVGYKGNTVTITGLPAGYKLRVAGVASPAAVAGQTTTVDVGGASFPVAQIEVLDQSNTVVKVYAPSDGVWGGDLYAYSSAP